MGKPLISRKQDEFLRATDRRINLLSGSVRSGKTYISLLKWALFVGSMPAGSEFIMCGKTVTALKRNCLNLLEQLIGRNFTFSLSQKSGLLFGRRIWLEGANDERSESKIRGMTLAGAYCDELTLFPQGFYNMLLSRLSERGAKLYATTNPDAPTHWVHEDVINNAEIDSTIWQFSIDDNPYLDPEYVANLKREYVGVFYDRFILGRWVRAEGAIYRCFLDDEKTHMISKNELPRMERIHIGQDIGGNKSQHAFCAVGLTSSRNRYDTVYVLKSKCIPAKEVTVDRVVRELSVFADTIKTEYGRLDSIFVDSAEQAIIATERQRLGYPIRNSIKNQINDRIRAACILMGLHRMKFVEGENDSLLRGIRDASWDEKSQEDKRLDDGSTNIDILDAWEYAWEGYMSNLLGER